MYGNIGGDDLMIMMLEGMGCQSFRIWDLIEQ